MKENLLESVMRKLIWESCKSPGGTADRANMLYTFVNLKNLTPETESQDKYYDGLSIWMKNASNSFKNKGDIHPQLKITLKDILVRTFIHETLKLLQPGCDEMSSMSEKGNTLYFSTKDLQYFQMTLDIGNLEIGPSKDESFSFQVLPSTMVNVTFGKSKREVLWNSEVPISKLTVSWIANTFDKAELKTGQRLDVPGMISRRRPTGSFSEGKIGRIDRKGSRRR